MSNGTMSKRLLDRQCEIDFQLELSRGASCIASCETEASLRDQVEETVHCFLQIHGPGRFAEFRGSLANKLIARGRRDAALFVASYPLPPQAMS
ncbi:hypothetical protein BN2476_70037 [Paraburkholderia piptadeniae]|uniref:Uncharacterized protein n=2 Tax=Paraburkholderia piptadeniae TaxID=1701573 RepID=A0A1N7RLA3_9BURK|nr:hypothetical protein BN2476_70037 [Paraburkholderia piptadeniae]